MNGHWFHYTNWKASFDPWNYQLTQIMTWIKLVDFPSEFWNIEAMKRLGDALGVCIGVDEDFINGKEGLEPCFLVEVVEGVGIYNTIEILTKFGSWKQEIQIW